ncbi:hypothetical protein TD95_001057 [Thielaviopsis punctulata]|uniref:Uncharacterized protein n=1 Tax=Thielaviopsis punctulata TaxID=72032 RepID=A0A0F4Z8U5_9PEZI|nr:hypothetical protein TD95_001067 [Thielaviopsis punctulata]KKA26959.1 hypothetical protein TD95_001057 [Thielaviopsis punctulata]
MSLWATFKSLAIFFGPIILPRAVAFYRSQRTAAARHGLSPRPLPLGVYRGLLLLGLTSTLFLLNALFGAPENVFISTSSRLQIPADVLFNRLSTVHPLRASDEALRARFVNLESRLLYLKYGPATLADCVFCSSDRPSVYFYYALPTLVTPHLVNILMGALATSPLLAGPWALRWRNPAVLTAIMLALIDVYSVYVYDYKENARALRLGELDMFFWRMRMLRAVGLALFNAVLGSLMYLTATNRAFVELPPAAMRVEEMNKVLAAVMGKLNAVGIVKNSVTRDAVLRSHSNAYWSTEAKVTQQLMEEREVVDSVNDALENNRIDVSAVTRSAQQYASNILTPWLAAAEEKAKAFKKD